MPNLASVNGDFYPIEQCEKVNGVWCLKKKEVKAEEVKKKKNTISVVDAVTNEVMVDFDINKDGVFDGKDASLAGKVLSASKKVKKVSKKVKKESVKKEKKY